MVSWLPTAISAGSSIFGGLFGSKKPNTDDEVRHRQFLAADLSRKIAKESHAESMRVQRELIQDRVKDAKAAGVHPLFALGASSGYSPVSYAGDGLPQQTPTPTGSAFARGLAQAGQTVAGHLSTRAFDKQNLRLVTAQADQAELATQASRLALAEQTAKVSPTRTFPLVESAMAPPKRLAPGRTYDTSRESAVKALEDYVRPDGSRGTKYTEDMQMDELGQVLVAYQDAKAYLAPKMKEGLRNLLFGAFSRQSGMTRMRGKARPGTRWKE